MIWKLGSAGALRDGQNVAQDAHRDTLEACAPLLEKKSSGTSFVGGGGRLGNAPVAEYDVRRSGFVGGLGFLGEASLFAALVSEAEGFAVGGDELMQRGERGEFLRRGRAVGDEITRGSGGEFGDDGGV
jgi:hypothetical protein